jgi:translation initiation factor IF-2
MRHRNGARFLENGLAKGIRVNQLAKELGIESKVILARLKSEGLGEVAPNHMSVMSMGLTESVREWFAGQGGVATAVEAPEDDASARSEKPRPSRSHKKKEKPAEGDAGSGHEERREAETTAETSHAPVEPAPAVAEKPHDAGHAAPPEAKAAEPVTETKETHAPPQQAEEAAPEVPAPHQEPIAEARPAAEAPKAAAAHAPAHPAAHAPAAPHGARPLPPGDRPLRQTITLENRAQPPRPPQHVPERKTVTPAPQLLTPKPAQIQGPRVIREEKPEVVATPRPRRPMGNESAGAPSFTTARAQTGRGVKVTEEDDDEAKKKAAAAKGGGRTLSNRRRGAGGRSGEAIDKIKEFSEQDLAERRKRIEQSSKHRRDFTDHLDRVGHRGMHAQAKSPQERGGPVYIEEPITVKTLSAAIGIKSSDIIGKLLKQGIFVTVNQGLDRETAEALTMEYGLELQIKQQATLEEMLDAEFATEHTTETELVTRPPVVTILGHVDHGKTSLLDKIRNANVAAGESGGITQHTAAWMVTLGEGEDAKRVTFIDTPGHQAFTAMRARGANMTDVVVLVVSAVEGVQPQTIESINHARAAEVPIVVAMNKIDRPDADPNKVLGQLSTAGLNPVEYGGDIEVVRTSATTGQGIKELIEILDLQSQIMELKAAPSTPARGTVIEARMDPGLGAVATVLVQDGTLKVGDIILSGPGYGRIRGLYNDRGKMVTEAGPSSPVIVSGLDELPASGDRFYVVDDIDRARAIAEERAIHSRQAQLASANKVTTTDTLLSVLKVGEISTINLIIKGDVQGSVETLVATVTGSNTDEVKVRVIHSGVGPVNESDVQLAMATMSKPTDNRVSIIGFHVAPEEAARALAEQNRVEIKLYKVIYEIFDDLKKALSGMLEPEVREKMHGHAEVRQVFKVSKIGNIAGCFCTDGHIQRGSKIRLIRNGTIITEDIAIETLKRLKDDVKEVKSGLECGIKLAGYDDIKVGDVLEAYIRETFQRTL